MIFFIKILCSLMLISSLFYFIDLENINKIIVNFSYSNLFIVMILLFIQNFILSYRWLCFLKMLDIKMNLFMIIRIYWSGLFFNQLMPSSLGGDVVKVVIATKTGYSFASISTTIILERVIGLLTFCFISILSLMIIDLPEENKFKFIVLAIPTIVLISVIIILIFSGKIKKIIPFEILRNLLDEILKGIKKMVYHKTNLAKIFVTTTFSHMCMFVIIYLLFYSLNVEVSFFTILYVMPLVFIISSLPISIAGWGVREASMVGNFYYLELMQKSQLL